MTLKQRFTIFITVYSESMKRFGFDFSRPQFNIVTTLVVIAAVAIIASAVLGVVSAFTPPKPSRISFGAVGGNDGPRYGTFGALDNTISNDLAVPVLYGQLKIAGNVIWQTDPGETVSRIIGLCEGLIQGITDVRANDNVIDDSNTPGSNYTVYLGSGTQKADSRVPGSLRPDLELHNLAYVALTLKVSENIKGGNPTITSICQGSLVEVWDGSAWGVAGKIYSRNPAACIRDFIINSRYGLGFPKANLDDAAFGSVYEYCQEKIASSAAALSGIGTAILLHMDGPNASQVFLDSSPNPKVVTVFGNTKIDTSTFKGGNASGLFNGTTDYLRLPDSNDYDMGTGEFTFRSWVKFAQVSINQTLFDFAGALASSTGMSLYLNTSNQWIVIINNVTVITVSFIPVVGTWYFWELVRSGSLVTLFIDGVVISTGTSAANLSGTDNGIVIGKGFGTLEYYLNGNLDEFEILKGIAAHTSSFDAPDDTQSRFHLDFTIDSQRPAQDVLNDMLATFGGFLVYSGSKIKLKVEKTEVVTQYFGDGSTTAQNASFDPNNIVRDSLSWNFPSVDDRPNRVKVQWVDPDQNYVKVYTQVDDRIDQDERNIVIVKEIALLGITRASQASRMAKLFMAKTKYASASVQFSARLESIHCEVGDVIAITHQAAMWTRKLMRITDMQEAEDETIRFTCTEYNASIYDDRPGAAVTVQQQPVGPNLYAPLSDVTNLTAREDNFKNKDGVFVVNILLTWTAIPNDQILRLDYHLIQYSEDGGVTYRDAGFASASKIEYRIVLGNVETLTSFVLRVKTISIRGAESVGETVALDVSGKVTPPANVEDFDVSFKDNHVAIDWSSVNDADLYGYEIRIGNENSVWETAAIVTTENAGTHYDHFAITRGSKKYFIKAIDNSGNYSEVAASDSILITNIVGSNVVANFDAWSRITEAPSKYPLFGKISGSRYGGLGSSLFLNCGTSYNSDAYILVKDSTDFDFTNQDFCIEGFFRTRKIFSQTSDHALVAQMKTVGGPFNSFFGLVVKATGGGSSSSGFMIISLTDDFGYIVTTPATAYSINTFYHIAVARKSNKIRIFLNGLLLKETDISNNSFPSITGNLRIGDPDPGDYDFNRFLGDVQEVRISKGTHRYDSSFSLSYTPFETDEFTMLLMHMDEGSGEFLKDSSGRNNHGVFVPNGNTSRYSWGTGIVKRKIDGVSQVPSSDYNPNYRRIALQTSTDKVFFDYQNEGFTYASLQASAFVFGEESFITTEEYWENEFIDLGGIVTANYILELLSSSTTNLGFITAQISYSSDNITYTSFAQFVAGLYTARYVKFRYKLQSITSRAICKLISAYLTIDAPDKEQNFLNQAISASGTIINLTGFTSVQGIVVTTVGTSNLTPRIHDQSNLPNSFEVRLFDISGVLQAGNVNINVKGY